MTARRVSAMAGMTVIAVCLGALAQPVGTTRPATGPATTSTAPAGGVVAGLLVAKGEDWVSVRADGQERGSRFATADKDVIAAIAKLTIPTRLKVTWRQAGDARQIVKLEPLAPLATSGQVLGTVTNKGENWIEVKDQAGQTERYFLYGQPKDVIEAISQAKTGDQVRLNWSFIERKRVMKLEKVAPAE